MDEADEPEANAAARAATTRQPVAPGREPWLGRFIRDVEEYAKRLTATANALTALLVAIGGVLAAMAAAAFGVLPWWVPYVLIGAPFALAVAHFVATRPRRRPAMLELAEAVPRGYFRIGPYGGDEKDRKAYRRADGAQDQVRDWLLRTEGAPLYLSGDSGAGKSSLLQAFVLPELQARGWRVVAARALADPEAALRDALAPGSPPDVPLRDAILAAVPKPKRNQDPPGLLLLLDQFEEFLILRQQGGTAEDAACRRFLDLLAVLREPPIAGLRLLLVLRKEYQADVERAGLPPLSQGTNWREVDSFTPRDAIAFLLGSGLRLDEQAGAGLVEDVIALDGVPAKVRPITLNMVGYVLEHGPARGAAARDVGALLHGHVARALRKTGITAHAPRLVPGLLTSAGTKRARALADLATEAGLDIPAARTVLLNLQAEGLVRPLGAREESWEVSHDFVARLLDRQLARSKPRRWWRRTDPLVDAEEARRIAEAEARRALADLGIFLRASGEADALLLESSESLSQAGLDQSAPYLAPFTGRLLRAIFSSIRIADLQPLAGLTALQSLDLSNTGVTKLAPLAGLTALRSLDGPGSVSAEARDAFDAARRARGLPPLLGR